MAAGFQLGWEAGREKNAQERQHHLAMEDEQRQLKVQDLYTQRKQIQAKLNALGYDPTNQAHLSDERFVPGLNAIGQINKQLTDIYKDPSAMQRDWGFIKGLITRKKPEAADSSAGLFTATQPTPSAPPAGKEGETLDERVPPSPTDFSALTGTLTSIPDASQYARPDARAAGQDLNKTVVAAAARRAPTSATPPGAAGAITPTPGKVTSWFLPPADTMAVPPTQIAGLVAPGNIAIWNRPSVTNDDGSQSTEFSISVTDERPDSPYYGKEVLVPTVVTDASGTHFLTPDGKKPAPGSKAEQEMFGAARRHYLQTGQQLGVFDNAGNADNYAGQLHSRGDRARPERSAYETPAAAPPPPAPTLADSITPAAAAPLAEQHAAPAASTSTTIQAPPIGTNPAPASGTAIAAPVAAATRAATPQAAAAPAAQAPSMTRKERKEQEEQARERQQVEQFMMGGDLSPKEQAEAQSAINSAVMDQAIKDYDKWHPNATPEQRQAFVDDLMQRQYAAITGAGKAEKYFSQIIPTKDDQGKEHYWRVPMDGSPPQEVTFGDNQQMVPKTAAGRGGGSDFMKYITAKYGPNPTPQQWDAARQDWTKAGARGYETMTDAAGNSMRVPVFTDPNQIPPNFLEGAGGGAGAAPGAGAEAGADALAGTQIPEIAPTAPGMPGQAVTGPAASMQLPSTLSAPSSPAFAPPVDMADAHAAMAYADRLSPGLGKYVQAVAEYRAAPPAASSRTGGKQFMDLVMRVNPAWDQTKWEAVQQGRKQFTAGGAAMSRVQSLGTAIGHLDSLRKSYEALGNTRSPDYNAAINLERIHTGDGRPGAVETGVGAVSTEVGSIFKSSGVTDAEVQIWGQGFTPNLAPDQFNQRIDKITDLMASRMVNDAQTYVDTFGTLRGFPVLTPEATKILRTFKTPGAQNMLEINREAMIESGIRPPAPDQPTTAPRPPGGRAQGGADQGWKTMSLAEARKAFPDFAKGKSDADLQEILMKQHIMTY